MSKDEYIKLLATASKTRYSELLLCFLNAYNLPGLRDATTEQLREYCEKKGLT
jgi:hypothetical protein